MAPDVYTLGYSGLPWAAFTRICDEHGVGVVVDIRTVPASRQPEFDGDRLPTMLSGLGVDYVSLPDLGDLEPDVDEADDAAFAAGVGRVRELARKAGPVLVLCHEPSARSCRRADIGQLLNGLGVSVAHLEPAGRASP